MKRSVFTSHWLLLCFVALLGCSPPAVNKSVAASAGETSRPVTQKRGPPWEALPIWQSFEGVARPMLVATDVPFRLEDLRNGPLHDFVFTHLDECRDVWLSVLTSCTHPNECRAPGNLVNISMLYFADTATQSDLGLIRTLVINENLSTRYREELIRAEARITGVSFKDKESEYLSSGIDHGLVDQMILTWQRSPDSIERRQMAPLLAQKYQSLSAAPKPAVLKSIQKMQHE